MSDEYSYIEDLAGNASKGEWIAVGDWVETDDDEELDPCQCDLSSFGQRFEEEDKDHNKKTFSNAAYIAAAQPANVVEMVKEIRRLRKLLEKVKGVMSAVSLA